MKIKNLVFLAILAFVANNSYAAIDAAKIKLELAKLEISKDEKDVGFKKCEELLQEIETQEKNAQYYTWKGIITAKMAKYKKSLSLAKEAKLNLEKAVEIDATNSDAAALNALGILYHRVPKFISFGDDKKAEEYFKQAIKTSNNLDTNWRYGEFLIDIGKKPEGLELLNAALLKADAKKPDEKIKTQIIQELILKNK